MRTVAAAFSIAAMACVPVVHSGEPLRDRLDLRYQGFIDANEVADHLGALLFVKHLTRAFAWQWEQTLDAVSGASRALGKDLRGESRPGDYDAVTGASPIAETRHAARAGLRYAQREGTGSASLYYSSEPDYVSLGPSLTWERDFLSGSLTMGCDASWYEDEFKPSGRFAGMGGAKRTRAGGIKAAWILTPLTLLQAGIGGTAWDGYLGHPYLPPVASDGSLLAENLPRRRRGMQASARAVQGYRIGYLLGSIDLAGKRYGDDWGLRSGELDLQWSQHFSAEGFLRLRARVYSQSGAAFAGVPEPDQRFRTADVRLFPFQSLLLGSKLASAFPESWQAAWFLPDRWDCGYEWLIRDTRGDGLGAIAPPGSTAEQSIRPRLYQLYGADSYYRQWTWSLGLGLDY